MGAIWNNGHCAGSCGDGNGSGYAVCGRTYNQHTIVCRHVEMLAVQSDCRKARRDLCPQVDCRDHRVSTCVNYRDAADEVARTIESAVGDVSHSLTVNRGNTQSQEDEREKFFQHNLYPL